VPGPEGCGIAPGVVMHFWHLGFEEVGYSDLGMWVKQCHNDG